MNSYERNMKWLEGVQSMTDDELSQALLKEERYLAGYSDTGYQEYYYSMKTTALLCEASRRALKNGSKTDEKCEKTAF